MCIVIYGNNITVEEIESAVLLNGDGFGFVYKNNQGKFSQTLVNISQINSKLVTAMGQEIEKISSYTPVLFHARWATIGTKLSYTNVQPFISYSTKFTFSHNGHVHGLGNDKKSDSRIIMDILDRLTPELRYKLLETYDSVYNKYVLWYYKENEPTLFGKWHKEDGKYYSNTQLSRTQWDYSGKYTDYKTVTDSIKEYTMDSNTDCDICQSSNGEFIDDEWAEEWGVSYLCKTCWNEYNGLYRYK